ncbi:MULTISPECIES: hypothetical protein [unclassified Nostoc]|uniref:NACHT domain-containing protein n=1 Tax=unclassified Nostoc TaxID=2593658 RepID=UPI0025D6A1EF|nr:MULTISPECIES: hypothetical protein [unclassified Nostoc]
MRVNFDTYRSLDFSYPQQVERFIHNWFAANPEKGEQLCTALKESGKERIQDLVKNPLRLTLLCLNWQSGDGKLPDTQAGLYQQFVDDFYKWKKVYSTYSNSTGSLVSTATNRTYKSDRSLSATAATKRFSDVHLDAAECLS